jgi:hypothetical protein
MNRKMKITPKHWTHSLLWAGLGNQMFMLATAYAYSLRYKTKLTVSKTWKGVSAKRPSYWDTFLTKWKEYTYEGKVGKVIKEKDYNYSEIPNHNQNISLKGYFQSEEYFKDYRDKVLNMFEFPDTITQFIKDKHKMYNIKEDNPTVAVHIRRGDYTKNKNKFYLQPIKYYRDSQLKIEEKLGIRPRYVYFSEDKKWVEDNFKLENDDIIIEGNKDYEDLALMSSFDYFIIANSSFSWWASYLGYWRRIKSGKESMVIAPSIWFGSQGPKNWINIYPDEWLIVDSSGYKIQDIYFLGLLSCDKYKDRREKQKIPNNFEYRYFIGDETLPENEYREDIENKIIYVPCPDNYENLTFKVYYMIKWVIQNRPYIKYLVKSDDDVKFNSYQFTETCKYINNKNFDYIGEKHKNITAENSHHFGKTQDEILSKTKIKTPITNFCVGPCYFLSRKSCNIIIDNLLKDYCLYEDISIGNCLFKNGIKCENINLRKSSCIWD